jgi:hypothetical protein
MVMQKTEIHRIIDVGAGLGHLSRILSMHLNCEVVTIEGNEELVDRARWLDNNFDLTAWNKPTRQAAFISEHSQIDDNTGNSLLVGLHCCGDLSPLILKNFLANAKALISFGCCYHKLNGGLDKLFMDAYTTEYKQTPTPTFPMSKEFADIKLTYASRELACYGIEQYLESLRKTSNVSLSNLIKLIDGTSRQINYS